MESRDVVAAQLGEQGAVVLQRLTGGAAQGRGLQYGECARDDVGAEDPDGRVDGALHADEQRAFKLGGFVGEKVSHSVEGRGKRPGCGSQWIKRAIAAGRMREHGP